jgi:RNA polymerase sigma factor (sigma-70 family)
MKSVTREELTELQRYTILAYYFENKTLLQIAEERNVNKSTVCRTLQRAEQKLRRFLQY